MSNLFSELCTPAKVYFVMAVFALVFELFRGISFGEVLINLIFAFVWTYILGWICKKGYKIVSWILVLAPIFFMIIYMTNSNSNKKSNSNSNKKSKTN